jgi:tRNA (guanine26-N2/guanine27-N2)-dimethyltransferase
MPPAPVKTVKEGTTEVLVNTRSGPGRGPGTRQGGLFYNPAMELNRDLSVLVMQWLLNHAKQRVHLLDGLAASGIRGIRYAQELSGDFDVTVNDWNPDSFSLMQENVQRTSAKNIQACQRDLNQLLSEQRYHAVDIDPFGSPVYFIDAAVRSIYRNGIVSCTATDTAALCGVFPLVCYRRYGAWPLHCPSMHEIGLRILLGVLAREVAKYDRGIKPMLSYTTDHYLRVYVQIINGKSAANTTMEQFTIVPSGEVPLSADERPWAGPLWLGRLGQKDILEEIRTLLFAKELRTKNQLWALLHLLEEEAEAPPFFYTTNDLSSLLKISPPTLDHVFQGLTQQGYVVTRTHCTPTGFKTNAPFPVIKEVFKQIPIS